MKILMEGEYIAFEDINLPIAVTKSHPHLFGSQFNHHPNFSSIYTSYHLDLNSFPDWLSSRICVLHIIQNNSDKLTIS